MTNWKAHFAAKKTSLKKKTHRKEFPCPYPKKERSEDQREPQELMDTKLHQEDPQDC